MKLQNAVKTLAKELENNEDLFQGYQANIAIQFQDEFNRQMGQIGRNAVIDNLHNISNAAAKNFLNVFCKDSRR